MNRARLEQLLSQMQAKTIVIIGDYFLDQYLDIDRSLAEVSIETGLEAYQVVAQRTSPGAAGNVAANVSALGSHTLAVGAIGQDGHGYELLARLGELGIDTDHLLQDATLVTPTYTKPMMRESDGRIHELSRLDIKNRAPLPPDIEGLLLARVDEILDLADGVIVNDQVPEPNCGAITERVRAHLNAMAGKHADMPFVVDSRERIGRFRHMALKPNDAEAIRACGLSGTSEEQCLAAGKQLAVQAEKPVFLTRGAKGCLVCSKEGCQRVPAVMVQGEIDTVGAGDTTLASIAVALCCGATPAEAAFMGNLAASVTIQCIGTTGVATPEQVLAAYDAQVSTRRFAEACLAIA